MTTRYLMSFDSAFPFSLAKLIEQSIIWTAEMLIQDDQDTAARLKAVAALYSGQLAGEEEADNRVQGEMDVQMPRIRPQRRSPTSNSIIDNIRQSASTLGRSYMVADMKITLQSYSRPSALLYDTSSSLSFDVSIDSMIVDDIDNRLMFVDSRCRLISVDIDDVRSYVIDKSNRLTINDERLTDVCSMMNDHAGRLWCMTRHGLMRVGDDLWQMTAEGIDTRILTFEDMIVFKSKALIVCHCEGGTLLFVINSSMQRGKVIQVQVNYTDLRIRRFNKNKQAVLLTADVAEPGCDLSIKKTMVHYYLIKSLKIIAVI